MTPPSPISTDSLSTSSSRCLDDTRSIQSEAFSSHTTKLIGSSLSLGTYYSIKKLISRSFTPNTKVLPPATPEITGWTTEYDPQIRAYYYRNNLDGSLQFDHPMEEVVSRKHYSSHGLSMFKVFSKKGQTPVASPPRQSSVSQHLEQTLIEPVIPQVSSTLPLQDQNEPTPLLAHPFRNPSYSHDYPEYTHKEIGKSRRTSGHGETFFINEFLMDNPKGKISRYAPH
ncbi:hypothetical protein BABINDRAFT_164208 [Babjeviella inositovora NRRL Y-12698]|uniref:WW domain-containing protein n=1 Tax=Babjeviella inositovora NRRL Y-12698 TaxID=984486 RepID=A0A1E3QZA1_9ASCO|nr:uncharacterized protein BABINDRAFT_164208 [Babjeviella inositovora NRRL Y-12698]ODQ82412.1 hypothetical protein BABINDRAFT_164208 [Babjeviella inositovora NRRL Y-12698]